MKAFYFVIMILLLSTLSVFAQPPLSHCTAQEPFDETGTADAYIYNLNEDCESNDWIVIFTDSEGNVTIYTNEDWAENDPSSNGWYDFGNGFWNCCGELAGGGGASDNTPTPTPDCDCEWDYDPISGFLTIDCPCL